MALKPPIAMVTCVRAIEVFRWKTRDVPQHGLQHGPRAWPPRDKAFCPQNRKLRDRGARFRDNTPVRSKRRRPGVQPPLRSHTRVSGIRYGCAGAAPNVQPDRTLLAKFAVEANIFVPEGALKWAATEPQPGRFDFSQGDGIAAFAARHGMLIHGHTLVWYAAIPQWVAQLTNAAAARTALERHITTEVERYRGRIWAWDVVNEAIEPNDGLENGYRNSVWFRCLGIDHVDLAFRLARAADPTTNLSLNEYGLEYTTTECQRRRAALLGLLQRLRDLKTPIDCVGLQSHLDADKSFDRRGLTGLLESIVKLGYRVMITELDVNDARIVGNVGQRDAAVARHIAEYLDIVFSVVRPLSIATWGLSDRYTWLI